MKKIIIFTLLILSFLISAPISKAEDVGTWNVFKKTNGESFIYETKNGDTVKLEKKINETKYRFVLNNNKKLYIDIENKAFSFVNFFESSSYFFLYGACYREIDQFSKDAYKPYIIRMNKDLSNSLLHMDLREDIGNSPYYTSMMEFGADNLIVSEIYNGTFNGITYNGLYVIHSFDEDLNITSSIDVGDSEVTLSVAYDCIDIKDARNNHMYFDGSFNRLDSYKREETIEGYFELLTDTIVNDEYYPIGSIFSNPGVYVLEDGYHERKVISLNPKITLTGEMQDEYYKESVSYQVSGGIVEINGETCNLNGTIYKPGSYTMKVKGIDGYLTQKTFIILPEFLTTIENNTLNVGDTLKFTGSGILNGTIIESGYTITEPGNYTFYLLAGDKVIEEIKFSVPKVTVTTETKNNVYIIYICVGIAVLIAIAVILLTSKKKPKPTENEQTP
ncbi:hypothetical protein IKQ02_04595 [bacterium]|nr:hypothetical protein [bacterium]